MPSPGDYSAAHPSRARLVIEVADSSLAKDRRVKAPIYAEMGAAEYWIVNLVDEAIEVHRGPRADGTWKSIERKERGERIALVAFPDVELAVDDVLPRRR